MNFQAWFYEADMPTLVNSQWVDLETGIPFFEGNTPRKARGERKLTALEIGGKAVTAKDGLVYARRLAKGQATAAEKARAAVQIPAVSAYLLAAEAALSAIASLTEKSKKADIANAIRLNQAASQAANRI